MRTYRRPKIVAALALLGWLGAAACNDVLGNGGRRAEAPLADPLGEAGAVDHGPIDASADGADGSLGSIDGGMDGTVEAARDGAVGTPFDGAVDASDGSIAVNCGDDAATDAASLDFDGWASDVDADALTREIGGVFFDVYGRPPSDKDIDLYRGALLDAGWTIAQVRSQCAHQKECVDDIHKVYGDTLAYDAGPYELGVWTGYLGDDTYTLASMRQNFVGSDGCAAAITNAYVAVCQRVTSNPEIDVGRAQILNGSSVSAIQARLAACGCPPL
ncbi:MAG TPA: hypothetical protein VGI39_00545 [Polyangiaceae bacterium]|jgi:hypothetical protein